MYRFRFVIDNRTGEGKIIEMSYGVGHDVSGSGGYWDRNYKWHSDPVSIENEIIQLIIREYQA